MGCISFLWLHNKLSQTQWLKTTLIFEFTVFWVRSSGWTGFLAPGDIGQKWTWWPDSVTWSYWEESASNLVLVDGWLLAIVEPRSLFSSAKQVFAQKISLLLWVWENFLLSWLDYAVQKHLCHRANWSATLLKISKIFFAIIV